MEKAAFKIFFCAICSHFSQKHGLENSIVFNLVAFRPYETFMIDLTVKSKQNSKQL